MAEVRIKVRLKKKPAGTYEVAVIPPRAFVPLGATALRWDAEQQDTTFPETDFIQWKSGGPPTPVTRSSDGKTLSVDYDNKSGGFWVYGVTISDSSVSIIIDPEVDNERPPGPFPKE